MHLYSGSYPPMGLDAREKTSLRGFANNKNADKPAHMRRLISAFDFRLSKSIESKLHAIFNFLATFCS